MCLDLPSWNALLFVVGSIFIFVAHAVLLTHTSPKTVINQECHDVVSVTKPLEESTTTTPPSIEVASIMTDPSKQEIWLLSFAAGTGNYAARLQEFGEDAEDCGWFDHIKLCDDSCFSEEYKDKYKVILSIERGHGLWFWKPYLILDLLSKMKPNDILIYLDAGCVLNCGAYQRFSEYIDMINNYGKGAPIISMQIPYMERYYSKMSLKLHLNLSEEHWNSDQIEGGIILSRNCPEFIAVLEEWMDVMAFEDGRFINEEEDVIPNDPDFVGTRNDQSVWSMLMKQHNGIALVDETGKYDPSMPIWALRKKRSGKRPKYHQMPPGYWKKHREEEALNNGAFQSEI